MTPDQIARLSIAHKGQTPWNKGLHFKRLQGKNHPFFGKRRALATRLKIAKKLMGRFRGKESPTWKGGRWKDERGYIRIPTNPGSDDYVYEHRLVMEKMIGRKLRSEEEVHHRGTRYPIDDIRNKSDNRIENLQLFNDKSSHVSFEKLNKKRGTDEMLCTTARL